MLLQGKTALVYGAGGAVGGAVAQAFARNGAHVILAGRTSAPLESTHRLIKDSGGSSETDMVDALDEKALAAHWAALGSRGRIHVMFNSIGWGDVQGELLTEMSGPEVIGPVTRAVTTWFFTGTAAARHMASHGGGVMIGMTAIPGRVHLARVGGFGIACAAVENLLRQLAFENGPAGVRVCFVRSSGSPDTPGLTEIFARQAKTENKTVSEVIDDYVGRAPLGRLPLLAEVADAAVLLASDYARGMTATLANVTCGAYVD